ncbi:preprotein translocase subunit SecE [Rhodovarius crocodyli]|uniref:Preprotein translocase subunit SecE n=1 Tax=Rhodovarius crocodyli TaxID=1979269 RepID=A0A437MGL7_9PROT|nr:preprotein translocase subunit SecE [Rhodovarius crocodyli]RVT96762.1 preprotein translocase subunit SecE [Rhodovarius crocodyli]
MAEQQTHYDYIEVKSQDIMAERAGMWDAFTAATKWGIIATIVLLVLIYLIWG